MQTGFLSRLDWTITLCAIVVLSLSVGCGEKQTSSPTLSGSPTRDPASRIGPIDARKKLVGVWLGLPSLDEAKLEEKLKHLDSQEQQLLLDEVHGFSTIAVAIDFRVDGSLEHEIEMAGPNGQLLRESGTGAWQIVGGTDDELVVETTEQLADGSEVKSKKRYRFSDGSDQFSVQIPAGRDLNDCNAAIVFRRQHLSQNNVAQVPDGNQQK